MSDTIRLAPIDDGSEEDCQCARCGSSVMWVSCEQCGGDGYVESSGVWGDGFADEWADCVDCGGSGGWRVCMSDTSTTDPTWCAANPLPGREQFTKGEVEWFTIQPAVSSGGEQEADRLASLGGAADE